LRLIRLSSLNVVWFPGAGYTREAASDDAAKYSGHSGLVGMFTAASEAGIAPCRRARQTLSEGALLSVLSFVPPLVEAADVAE